MGTQKMFLCGVSQWLNGRLKEWLKAHNTAVVFTCLVLISALVSNVFLTLPNVFNLLRQVCTVGIMSMGMLVVILTSGIDLSVGSVMALASVITARTATMVPLPLALLAALGVGIGAGAANGYLVAKRHVAPFIATLALMTIARGLAFICSQGHPIRLPQSAFPLAAFARGYTLGLPRPALLLVTAFAITAAILRYTVFGRLVIALGSNESAVRLSGINTKRHKFYAYAFCGVCAALAGIVSTARTNVGSAEVGTGIELDVIAAVVIGGASLSGGRGSALNTILGVLTLGVIANMMNLVNVPGYHQQIIKGAIIIAAVVLQSSHGPINAFRSRAHSPPAAPRP